MKFQNVILALLMFSVFAEAKSHPNPHRHLFDQLAALERVENGQGQQFVILNELRCDWPTSKNPEVVGSRCLYKVAGGEEKKLTEKTSNKIVLLLKKMDALKTQCGAGTCKFDEPIDLACKRDLERSELDHCEARSVAPAPKAPAPSRSNPNQSEGQR